MDSSVVVSACLVMLLRTKEILQVVHLRNLANDVIRPHQFDFLFHGPTGPTKIEFQKINIKGGGGGGGKLS